ncbi:MAG TPA: hypothetical protein VFK33_14475 [Bacillales bacterium]|nr:hypothetical protein [Bacillales bacterium]
MNEKKRVREQLENVREDYPHPSVTNDVIKTEFEAYPGHLEEITEENDGLGPVEESVVENTTDGKTWNDED